MAALPGRHVGRASLRGAGLAAILLLAVGCGHLDPPRETGSGSTNASAPRTAGTPDDAGGVPSFSGRLSFHGDTPVEGDWSNSLFGIGSDSCADIAQSGNGGKGHGGETGSFEVPGPEIASPVNGTDVTLSVSVPHYSGPGSYGKDRFHGNIQVDGADGTRNYDLGSDAVTGKLTVNADGSGRLEFEQAPDPSHKETGPLGGVLSWLCH